MSIRIRKTTTANINAGALAVDISHTNDSIRLGDGTNLLGTLTDVGGVRSLPVDIKQTVGATDATLTGGTVRAKITDGVDNVGISTVGAVKALKVDVVQTAGAAGGTSMTDDAVFTPAVSSVTPMGAFADETAPDSVDEGDIGALRMTLDRLLKIQLAGLASGVAVPVTDNGGSLTVDGTVAVSNATFPVTDNGGSLTVDGTVAVTGVSTEAKQDTMITALQLIDDTVATTAAAIPTKGLAISGTDGTNARVLKTDASGELQVDVLTMPTVAVTGTFWQATQPVSGTFWQATQPVSGTVTANLAAGTNNIGDVDVLTLPGVAGTVAHDSADSGNPVKVGGVARNANPTAVANGDRVDATFDLAGRQVVTYADRALVTRSAATTISTTTETTLIAAGGAGVFHDLTMLVITNTSSTAVRVDIRDAAVGTVQFSIAIAANGGAVLPFGAVPLNQTTANTAWTAQLSAAVTDIRILATAVKRV